MGRILLVEDDEGLRDQLRWALEEYEVFVAGTQEEAITLTRRENPDVVVLDLGLPPDPNGAAEGLATLRRILAVSPVIKVIVSSGNEDRQHALEAIQLGAYDFYPKPVDLDDLKLIISRAKYLHDLEVENVNLSQTITRFPLDGVIAASPVMMDVCATVKKLASFDVSVLLNGESGTGKEVLANAIHNLSPRANRPMIAINCAAIPENLLESELFGHEKGSFTGAIERSIGKVEQAEGGTLFLDEIGDMPLSLQTKMLRFLQERTIERIGGRSVISVNARVVSATNRNLEAMIAEGSFREDLYYRLNEMSINIPALRERADDSILLARYFLNKYANEYTRKVSDFTDTAKSSILTYSWPGNVRELEGKIKRSVILTNGNLVDISALGLDELEDGLEDELGFPTLRQIRENAERGIVLRALALSKNKISGAAKLLGVTRPTLYDLLNNLGLK